MNKGFSILFSVLIITFFLLNRYNAFSDKEEYFSQDLRNRVVGARILSHKKHVSPYFFKWHTVENNFYLDPYDTPDLPMNRNTVTPFTLQLLAPFSDINYNKLSLYWFFTENLALFLILAIFFVNSNTLQEKIYSLFVCIGLAGLSQAFFLHNLAGQYYIIFPLLLSAVYFLSRSSNVYTEIISGILFAIMVLIRPNLIVFLFPFLIKFRWKFIFTLFTSLIMYVLMTCITDKFWLWSDYFKAMNLWYDELFKPDLTRTYLDIFGIHQVEGSVNILRPSSLDFLENTSVVSLVNKIFGVQLSKVQLFLISIFSFVLILISLAKKIKSYSMEKLFVLTFLFYFISELCIPAIRNSYNSVQWIFPLLLAGEFNRKNIYYITTMAVGFLFSTGLIKVMPYDLFISEIIFLFLCLFYLFNYNIQCKKQLL